MQDPQHQLAKCATCHAAKRQPCTNRYGTIAEKVHYGRPYWSSVAKNNRPAKIKGQGAEIEINLEEFKVIKDLHKRTNRLDNPDKPVLFASTNICADCGEPYDQPGLVSRCRKRHERVTA